MLRFGDHLTEEVLQCLALKEKIRHECVSKQWRRLVYNRQYKICLYTKPYKKHKLWHLLQIGRQSTEQVLESVLKKCPNITSVDIRSDRLNISFVLSLIGQYCPNIRSLNYTENFNEQHMNYLPFFHNNGHKLEELSIYGYSIHFDKILKYCPNLKKIQIPENYKSALLPTNKEILPKIEEFQICLKNKDQMKILSDKYSQTMKILNIEFYVSTTEDLKTCFECIARFENLKQLSLCFINLKTTQPIDDCLSLIGLKCNKLLKLDLCFEEWVPIPYRLFYVFNDFKTIKKLKITLSCNRALPGSVECFKHCEQLNDIDINYSELSEDFFANIASFVPKLQSLRITTQKQFSESFFDSLHSMKQLEKVYLNIKNNNFTGIQSQCRYFGKGCEKITNETIDVIQIPVYYSV